MNIFGENLQFYRKKRNLTQEQLAEQLDVSRQTISKWEAGASYPERDNNCVFGRRAGFWALTYLLAGISGWRDGMRDGIFDPAWGKITIL